MNRTSLFNLATLLVPLICFLVAGGVVFYEWRRIQQLDEERIQAEKQIAFVENLMADIQRMPLPSRFPTAEMTTKEQPDFLNTLRASADANLVRLVKWSNSTPVLATSAGSTSADATTSKLPPGVISIASGVEIIGRYERIRQFLYDLLRSPRLFSISDVHWMRGDQWPNTHITFTLTRYVTQGRSPFSQLTSEATPPGVTYGAPSAFGTRGEGGASAPPVPPPGQPLGPSAPERMPQTNP